MPSREDDFDELDPREFPDPEDRPGATQPCPYCKRAIHEFALQCQHCGSYISDEDQPSDKKPWWMVAGLLLCLAMAISWVFL